RQALLLDLLEDDQEGPRVQRDLRPHGHAGHRRVGEGLLRRGGRHPLAVEAAARALQGLHRDAQVQHVPVAAHDGHRARGTAAGATPLDFAYEVHTETGHRCVGAKVNGKMVPLSYQLKSGDIVEVLTAKRERGPSRDWLAVVKTTRARNKIKQWFKQESREDTEHTGRTLLQEHLTKAGLPAQKITGSPLLADVIREMGFRKADDFY